MKKQFYLALTVGALNFNVLSQYSYSISYECLEIVEYSIQFSYSSNGTYQPYTPYVSSQNTLATLQARYDYNYSRVSTEWGKLLNLKLVNNVNKKLLLEWQTYINTYIKNNSSNVDWSSSATTESWLNFIIQPYQVASIKSELALLQSCKLELDRIKYKDPDNYLYSKRYQSIVKTLDLLKNCDVSEINNLSWEKIELENTSNNNSSSSNNDYFKVPNTNYTYKKNHNKIQIDKITNSGDYTIIDLTYFSGEGLEFTFWVNFSPNAFVIQNGKKYYLQKAEGIPLSPNKYFFQKGDKIESYKNQSVSFKLYFDKSINLNVGFDLIEIEGDVKAFNFYNISK